MLLPRQLLLLLLLQEAIGPVEVPRGRLAEASELPDGLAHGAGVVGQPLDVFEGQVDDLVAAGVTVEVSAGETLQAGLVGDAALAVRQVGAQRQGAGQGTALQAAGQAGALLGGRPNGRDGRQTADVHATTAMSNDPLTRPLLITKDLMTLRDFDGHLCHIKRKKKKKTMKTIESNLFAVSHQNSLAGISEQKTFRYSVYQW